MADWLAILDLQTREAADMARAVPTILGKADLTAGQAKTLFDALEKQADFAERLKAALEKLGNDFTVIDKADRLVDCYGDLAAAAGERLKQLRGAVAETAAGQPARRSIRDPRG